MYFLLSPALLGVWVEDGWGERFFLQNPGFEEGNGPYMAYWKKYPPTGETCRLFRDTETKKTGVASAAVFIEQDIEYGPVNWSQQLFNPPVGKTVRISGDTKTEGVNETSIWFQCWGKTGELLRKVSSDASYIGGTQDWTHLEFEAEIPPDTQSVMVRCVVVGTGKAWFDNVLISLEEEESEPAEDKTSPEEEAQDDVSRITDLSLEALTESNKAIGEANRLLREQIQDMRGQLVELRKDIAGLKAENERLKRSLSDKSSRPPRPVFRGVPKE